MAAMRCIDAAGSGPSVTRVLARFSHNLKRCRCIATRYDKTGRASLAFVHLAAALIWLA